MGKFKTVIALAAGLIMSACATSIPGDQSIADYCASSDHAGEAVCRLSVEVDGNTTAIANTKLSLEEAQALAAAAKLSADEAGAAAVQAQMDRRRTVVVEPPTLTKSNRNLWTWPFPAAFKSRSPTFYSSP